MRRPRIYTRLALVAGLLLLPAGFLAGQEVPFARLQSALDGARVADAESSALLVLAQDTVSAHRRDALLALANLAWRIHGDTAAADSYLRTALTLPLPDARSAALLQRARGRLALGDYAGAEQDARAAAAAAVTLRDRLRALAVVGRAVTEPALANATAPVEPERLSPLLAQLMAGVEAAPGDVSVARELVAAAAIARDGPALLAGWHSYYLTYTGGASAGVLGPAGDTLRRVLPTWSPGTDGRAARRSIVLALAGSRFFVPAGYLARLPLPDGSTLAATDPRLREIVDYADYLRRAQLATNDYYRLTALHAANEPAWRDSLDQAARWLWVRFAWSGAVPTFTPAAFAAEAGRRFGLALRFGVTAGYQDAHIGHTLSDAPHTVRQWGHTAAFHFVQLDQMVSNGFLSWFWDGNGADGGWNAADTVVQVRPAYASGPIRAWLSLTDSAERAESDAATAADSAADLARARTTPVAYFPGVEKRLRRVGQETLLDSLRASGLTGDRLREAFVRQLSDETLDYSIFQHEGRHAIDRGLGAFAVKNNDWVAMLARVEFTAKLAQVEFGPNPALAFNGIMTASVGDATPHGRADARLLTGLLEWMKTHEGEIAHLDRAAPLLPQLPLLTPEQLRAACRSLDPLARPGIAAGS